MNHTGWPWSASLVVLPWARSSTFTRLAISITPAVTMVAPASALNTTRTRHRQVGTDGQDAQRHAHRQADEHEHPVPRDPIAVSSPTASVNPMNAHGEDHTDLVVEVGEEEEHHRQHEAHQPAERGAQEAVPEPRLDEAGTEEEAGERAPDGDDDAHREPTPEAEQCPRRGSRSSRRGRPSWVCPSCSHGPHRTRGRFPRG